MTNKILLLAAASVLSLGMGSAFAQSETHDYYPARSNSAVVSTPSAKPTTGISGGDAFQPTQQPNRAWMQYNLGAGVG